jgi:hypothetical protein
MVLAATEGANRHYKRGGSHDRRGIGNRNWNWDGDWRISVAPIITVPIVDLLDHPAGDVRGGRCEHRPWGGVARRARAEDAGNESHGNEDLTHSTLRLLAS